MEKTTPSLSLAVMKTPTLFLSALLLMPGFLAAQVLAPVPNSERPLQTEIEVRTATEVKAAAKASPKPAAQTSPEAAAQTSPEPAAETSPEPVSQTPPEPAAETPPEPVAQTPPEPAAETSPESVAQTPPEPAAETSPEPAAQISAETRAILRDDQQRDRAADIEAAMQLQNDAEAQLLIDSILAKAQSDTILSEANARDRQRLAEAGRTAEVRRESITYLSNRLRGEVPVTDAPASFRSRSMPGGPTTGRQVRRSAEPHYYDDHYRVVTYRTMNEVPPVLIASSKLNRVQVQQFSDTPYATSLVPVQSRPVAYSAPEAYSVSYAVDPNSSVARDDILFEQGSTAFRDAYSYDLVQDIAMAISDPSLTAESFVIEGHASMEGDYHSNLALSQARAERIAREMVHHGVSPSRLIPVGYGQNEAMHPAGASEDLRTLDRRVAVYRLQSTEALPR